MAFSVVTRRAILAIPPALLASTLPGIARAQQRDRVVIGVSLTPPQLDPTSSDASIVGEVTLNNVLEGLTKILENGKVAPLLAKSWSLSDDKLTMTFRLIKNARFHDGSAFDAQVVKFSINRAQKLGLRNKSYETLYKNISNVIVHDKYTVALKLRHPDPLLTFRLGESPAVMVHPDSAHKLEHHPIGTGPYLFSSLVPDQSLDLTRWPKFRDMDRVAIRHAQFRFLPSPDMQIKAIQNTEVDMLFHMSLQGINHFNVSHHYQVLLGSTSSKMLVAINNRQPPLDDIRVRQALSHAIDRSAFITEAFGGRGQGIGSHFVPTDPAYINQTSVYPYNPDKARQLLEEAGVSTPLKLTLALPPTPYARAGGPVLKSLLSASGIDLTLRHVTWKEWLQTVFRGKFDLSLIMHVEPFDYHIYARSNYYFGYDSPDYLELVTQYQHSTNPRERRALMHQIQRTLTDDAVNVWLLTPEMATITRKGLKGVWMDYPIFSHYIADMYWS